MFRTKEDLIIRIAGKDPSVIITAILEELEPYKVARIVRKVLPLWTDDISYEDLCEMEFLRTRLSGDNARCNLCGYTSDISKVYAHVQICEVLVGLSKQCNSLEEFYDYLRQAYGKEERIRKIRE